MIVSDLYNSMGMRPDKMAGSQLKRLKERADSFEEILKENIRSDEGQALSSKTPGRDKEDKRLKDVCIQMESIFVARMLKEMRKTVHKGELLHGGFAEEVFEDMLYDEYALSLSKSSNLGLATMLYDELSRK